MHFAIYISGLNINIDKNRMFPSESLTHFSPIVFIIAYTSDAVCYYYYYLFGSSLSLSLSLSLPLTMIIITMLYIHSRSFMRLPVQFQYIRVRRSNCVDDA